jgi:hypothetical protein
MTQTERLLKTWTEARISGLLDVMYGELAHSKDHTKLVERFNNGLDNIALTVKLAEEQMKERTGL